MHEGHAGRPPRLAAMADQRARALEEDERLVLRLERQLLRVVGVVEAERDHACRPRTAAARPRRPRRRRGRRRGARIRLDARPASPRGSRPTRRRARASCERAPRSRRAARAGRGRRSRPRPAAPARTRGAPGALPVKQHVAGRSVMKSLTSARSRAAPTHEIRGARRLRRARRRRGRATASASGSPASRRGTTTVAEPHEASRALERIGGRKWLACGTTHIVDDDVAGDVSSAPPRGPRTRFVPMTRPSDGADLELAGRRRRPERRRAGPSGGAASRTGPRPCGAPR